jgi:hypothetical protein
MLQDKSGTGGSQHLPNTKSKANKEHLKQPFLDQYAKKISISQAAQSVGITRMTVLRWRESDPKFAEKFNEIDSTIVDNLQQRAIVRALTDSDASSATLLIFLLKAKMPDVYREKIVHEVNMRFMNTLITDVTLILRKHMPVELSNTIAKELEALSNRLIGNNG